MLAYPSAIDLASSHSRSLTRRLAERRRQVGTRWRRRPANRQTPLVLAHLRRSAWFATATRATRVLAAPYGCKSWRLLRTLRCSTTRITGLAQAVLALHIGGA